MNWNKVLFMTLLFLEVAAVSSAHAANTQIEIAASKKEQRHSSKKQPASKSQEEADAQDDAVRMVLMGLSKAANEGDANRMASYWSDDAIFIDQTGQETRGRTALQERFSKAIEQRTASELTLHPERISLPSPSVALVVGSVSRKIDSLDLPATRFSLMLLKENDAWRITQATETAIQQTSAADHLKELEWLVGKWQVDKPDNAPTFDVQWGNRRNFIVSKISVNRNGLDSIDTQVIGWDPRTSNIVSWHFNSNGGFGYGTWSKESDRWIVDFAGVAADGSGVRATNIFTATSPDEFTWQSTDQSSGGAAVADTGVLKVKKIKP